MVLSRNRRETVVGNQPLVHLHEHSLRKGNNMTKNTIAYAIRVATYASAMLTVQVAYAVAGLLIAMALTGCSGPEENFIAENRVYATAEQSNMARVFAGLDGYKVDNNIKGRQLAVTLVHGHMSDAQIRREVKAFIDNLKSPNVTYRVAGPYEVITKSADRAGVVRVTMVATFDNKGVVFDYYPGDVK